MKLSITLSTVFFLIFFAFTSTRAQNISINILTQNSGIVNLGGTVFLEVTINNTDESVTTPTYKLRPQISVPPGLASIATTGHVLPNGWTILSNNGSVMRLTNGTDGFPANSARTLLIAIQGHTLGAAETIAGNLAFSNGNPPGSAAGAATPGDNPSDNASQTTIEVTNTTPVTLINFNAALINCQPTLSWTTETEVNSDHFEIERSNQYLTYWTKVGVAIAKGNSTTKVKYNFTDNNVDATSEKILYRLKIVDKDGQYKYSEIVPVFINCETTLLYAYPNPVQNGNLYISLAGTDKYTNAVLLSLSGQVVLRTNLKNNATNTLNVANISNGEYILNVNFENGTSKNIKVFIKK